jgi:FlaA1/EpsC-like NDP-sugar epimerase
LAVPVKTAVFLACGLFHGWWRYVGIKDALAVLAANVAASAVHAAACFFVVGRPYPISVALMDFFLCFFLSVGIRFHVRIYTEIVALQWPRTMNRRILIYGAGGAGTTLVREITGNPSLKYDVVGFIDDDPKKYRAALMGVPVLGRGRGADRIVQRFADRGRPIDEIVIAMPSATGKQMKEAVANCRATGVPFKTIPGIGELLQSKNLLTSRIRDLSVEDLLGREPVQLDEASIRASITGRAILVTGAAGSIGSEICRQVASYEPSLIVAFDQAESPLYQLDVDLRKRFPMVTVIPWIGDIRDAEIVDDVMGRYSFDAVFHAAAYKHVPLMEVHPLEVAKANVLGTWHVARAAARYGVSNFVMISSDKAVRPTSLMGLTKRVAELVVGSMANDRSNRTRFVSVRFGNVLGSNGSVVPLFKEQISSGGPVTVTHPEVRRYFMTAREAVQLVLQASAMGKGSQTFVLDMGEPVVIADLARNMIRLAGLDPDEDIEIRFVGLRPGEKMYEELITGGENVIPTNHKKIKIFQGASPNPAEMAMWMRRFTNAVETRDEAEIVMQLADFVPDYQPTGLWTGVRSALQKSATIADAS